MFLIQQALDSEASLSALPDVPNSAASEPDAAPLTDVPAEDAIVSNQQPEDVDVAVSAAVSTSADTVAQLPSAEKDAAQSADSPKPEPVFASASEKPKPEIKGDLSSMFKSLSAKMMRKRERQSRFSDIAPAASASSRESSDAVVAVTENSESGRLLHTSVDAGSSNTNTVTVHGTGSGNLLPPFSRAMENLALAVGSQSNSSTFGLQNDDVLKKPGGSLSLSNMPICLPPLPPGIITSAPNSGIFAVTRSVPGVMPSLPGL